MKHLFEAWNEVELRIRRAHYLFLLMDYDGTLTPIVARPELAVCPPGLKPVLENLRDSPRALVAIISGRALEDLKEKVGVTGITYVGNHGLEIENPAGVHRKNLSPRRQDELKQIRKSLESLLKPVQGVLFEDKGPILSVHYRNAPREASRRVQEAVQEVLESYPNRWQLSAGKKIFEILPRMDFDKGKTIQELLLRFSPTQILPVYLGDDPSDEDAFRAIHGRGIPIRVGNGTVSSAAFYFLRGPAEVLEFLRQCEGILGK
jgi:trehalose-phosphatase